MRCQRCGEEACRCAVPVYVNRSARSDDGLSFGGCAGLVVFAVLALGVGNVVLTWAAEHVAAFWSIVVGLAVLGVVLRLLWERR